MCRLGVHLEYGLNVNALSLLHAARGWADSEPARIALDVICQRRNLGTLKADFAPPTPPQGVASSAIELVPINVWQLVKQELTALATEVAVRALLEEIRQACVEFRWKGVGGSWPAPPHHHTNSLVECQSCFNYFRVEYDFNKLLLADIYKAIDRLLADFGLKHVKNTRFGGAYEAFDLDDARVIAISRPPSIQHGTSDSYDKRCSSRPMEVGCAVSLEQDVFELPAAADASFQHLFEHFPALTVADYPHQARSHYYYLPGRSRLFSMRSAQLADMARQMDDAQVAGSDKAKPAWMLCSNFKRCF